MEITTRELPGVNTLVIRSKGGAFRTTKDSVIINKTVLTHLILALMKKGQIDYKPIEGMLEEIHTL